MAVVIRSVASRSRKTSRILTALALQVAWLVGSAASAATFVVSSGEDEPDAAPGDGACSTAADDCTLRAAVDEANALPGLDHIYLSSPPSSPFVLERGPLVVSDDVQIAGREARFSIIDARGASRIIEVAPRAGAAIHVRLAALTLNDGFASESDPNGGAILNADPASTLVIDRSLISNSRAVGSGGAIFNAGHLELRRSALQANSSGLYAASDPAAAGGGIHNTGSASIERVSFDDNEAREGAGLANAAGTAELTSVTFSNNAARVRGGAVFNAEGAAASLTFCTIADNEAGIAGAPGRGAGIHNAGTLQLAATIVANNRDLHSADSPDFAPDCVSEGPPGAPPHITSRGGLVLGVVTPHCVYAAHASDHQGSAMLPIDPGFFGHGSREFEVSYGYDLGYDSVARNAVVDPALCVGLDQWGARRPGDELAPGCDAGAVDSNGQRIRRSVMMIVGDRVFSPTDLVLSIKLFDNGFDVFDESPSDLSAEVRERQLALISETVTSSELPSWLYGIERPILTLEPGTLDELGMTRERWDSTQGVVFGEMTLNVLPAAPIDIGVSGPLVVTDSGAKFAWGVPATHHAFKVAELASAPGRYAIFGYEAGAKLANRTRAPAARVAFFAATDTPLRMNDAGWKLFEATLNHVLPPP